MSRIHPSTGPSSTSSNQFEGGNIRATSNISTILATSVDNVLQISAIANQMTADVT